MSTSNLDPIATGFVVNIPAERVSNCFFHYFVTAKHVFNGPPNTKIQYRVVVNKRGGGLKVLDLGGWYISADSTLDVAVAPIGMDREIDVASFRVTDFFDEERNPENIGAGDEVFFPGLFTLVPGIGRIQPMVRHGNIAMLPKEQIQTADGFADIYLIEARSIGGLSGSPVFARETIVTQTHRDNEQKTPVYVHSLGVFKLLGLIQGHWDVDESRINQAYTIHDPKRGVNMGIAKVVPAKKIKDLIINDPDLLEIRKREEDRVIIQRAGTLD